MLNMSSSLFIISVYFHSFIYALYHLITSCLPFPPRPTLRPFLIISSSHSPKRRKGIHYATPSATTPPWQTKLHQEQMHPLLLWPNKIAPLGSHRFHGRQQNSIRDNPRSNFQVTHIKTKLHICSTFVGALGLDHACFLVGGSISMNAQRVQVTWLSRSPSGILDPSGSLNPSSDYIKRFPEFCLIFGCACPSVAITCCMNPHMMFMLGFCPEVQPSIIKSVRVWLSSMRQVSSLCTHWLVIPSISAPSLSLYILQAGTFLDGRFCGWVGVPLLPLEILPGYRKWPFQSPYPQLLGSHPGSLPYPPRSLTHPRSLPCP